MLKKNSISDNDRPNTNEIDDDDEVIFDDQNDANDLDYDIEEDLNNTKTPNTTVNLEYKIAAVNYYRSRRMSFKTIQKRFRRVTSVRQLLRWEKYIRKGGSKTDKRAEVNKYTLNAINTAFDHGLPVTNKDIRQWALEASEKFDYTGFRARCVWLAEFKAKHGIVFDKSKFFF